MGSQIEQISITALVLSLLVMLALFSLAIIHVFYFVIVKPDQRVLVFSSVHSVRAMDIGQGILRQATS